MPSVTVNIVRLGTPYIVTSANTGRIGFAFGLLIALSRN
jgi:hypothetical protein